MPSSVNNSAKALPLRRSTASQKARSIAVMIIGVSPRVLSNTSPDLGHGGKNARDVLRAGEAVIAVLDHGQHDVVGRQAVRQREGVLPGDVGILRALENADGATEV